MHKKIGGQRGSKAIKKHEMTGCLNKAIPSTGRSRKRFRFLQLWLRRPGVSTGAPSTQELLDVKVEDNWAPAIPPSSSSGKGGTSSP